MSLHFDRRAYRRSVVGIVRLSALATLLMAPPLGAIEDEDPLEAREEELSAPQSEGGERLTILELGVDGDGTGAAGGFASVRVPIGPKNTIAAAFEHTTFDDFEVLLSDGSVEVVDAKPATRIALNYRHAFDRIGIGFGAERWGNEDQLEIDDLSVGVDYRGEQADWFLDLIDRSAEATFPNVPGGPREGTVGAWGVNTGFSYLTRPLDFYMMLGWYDYDEELGQSPIQAILGNRSALSVADSLIDRSALVGGRHQFEIWSFGMEAGWYRGAVTSNEVKTLAAIFGFPVSPRLDMTLTLGGASADFEDTTAYGVLSLTAALGGA